MCGFNLLLKLRKTIMYVKKNLDCTINSIFAGYHLQIIPKLITVLDDNILMHSKQYINWASLVAISLDNWRSTVFFTEKKPVEQRKSSILFRTRYLLTLPMHTCIYTHTHIYIYTYIHTMILVYFGVKAYHSL
jgi:hypothetical protein